MTRDVHRIFDELLVLHALEGDRAALDKLAERWRPKHYAHARRLLRNPEDAADAVQDAWVHIAGGLWRIRQPERFAAWSYAIVTRRCQDRMRKVYREPAGDSEIDVADPAGEIDGRAGDMRRALAALPPEQKAAVALFYQEGFTIPEIALALRIPPGTVKSRLFHARQVLRQFFDEGDER